MRIIVVVEKKLGWSPERLDADWDKWVETDGRWLAALLWKREWRRDDYQ